MTPSQLEVERLLIERAKADPEAFGELFDTYYDAILRYVVRRTANVALAQDITSEVFIKALKHLPTFRWQGVPLSAWLYRIAMNELRMHYRSNRTPSLSIDELLEESGLEIADEHDLVEELQDAQFALERHTDYLRAQRLILQLPIKYQEVISLRFGEDKKTREIAQILGKSEGTVKSLLSRAMTRLRADMQSEAVQPFRAHALCSTRANIIQVTPGKIMNDKHLHQVLHSTKQVTTALPAHKTALRGVLLARHQTQQASTHFSLEAFTQRIREMHTTIKAASSLKKISLSATAFAVIATGSVGAYALTNNWFGATAGNAQQKGDIISVDLSGCKAHMPGVSKDQAGTAKFKVVTPQHISAASLQQQLLASCEAYSVLDFYAQQSPYAAALNAEASADPLQAHDVYSFQYGTVASVNPDGSLTVDYRQVGSTEVRRVSLPVAGDATYYNQGSEASKSSLASGDSVVLLTKWNGTNTELLQKYGGSQNMNPDSTVVSVYKTTSDVKNSIQQKDFFQLNGVQPLN